MEGSEEKFDLVKVCNARFCFKESCDFSLDYKGFINSNYDKHGSGKNIRIRFNSRSARNLKLDFKCRYKMMTNYEISLN